VRSPTPLRRAPYYELSTFLGAENSEVSAGMLKKSLVAVAVIVRPTATFFLGLKVKVALPLEASVATIFFPMNFLPSSPPGGLEKNSIM
jgi:hypothetical protein